MIKDSQIIEKYTSGLSAREVATLLGCTQKMVYSGLKRHSIPRRSSREASLQKRNRKKRSFRVRTDLSSTEEHLRTIAIALYWAEGAKTTRARMVDIANTDVRILKIFLHFLRTIMSVDDDKLRVYVYCHSNQNVSHVLAWWSDQLQIPIGAFQKPFIRHSSSKSSKWPYGVAHIRYYDVDLLRYLLEQINLVAVQ